MSTFDFFIEVKKVRFLDMYHVTMRSRVDGELKTTFNLLVETTGAIDKKAFITAANYVSGVEGLNLHEKLVAIQKAGTLSDAVNTLHGKKAVRYTRRSYRGYAIYSTLTIDDFIKKGDE